MHFLAFKNNPEIFSIFFNKQEVPPSTIGLDMNF